MSSNKQEVYTWLDEHKRQFGCFINNQWVKPEGAKFRKSVSPSTEEEMCETMDASTKEVDQAMAAARQAFKSWGSLTGHQRAHYMIALARQLEKKADFLAVMEAMDNGKPVNETRNADVPIAIRHFYHYAGWAELMDDEMKDYSPVGVCAEVVPWNFPLMMLAWKICPALAMGNTVVLKPASYTRLTALAFAEICVEAGLPAGVFNLVTGSGSLGSYMADHPETDKVAFTGSTDVGRILRRRIAGSGKKISLELGGKSPFVVFDSADIDSAIEGMITAIFFNQGQVCCAGSRLVIQDTIYEEFVEKLKKRMQKMKIGPSLADGVDMAALVDETQLKTVSGFVERAKKDGCIVWQPDVKLPEVGIYYPPTLITNCDSYKECVRQEIFGPVVSALKFHDKKQAIEIANDTNYGLGSSVWTENMRLALEVSKAIKAGTVWVNSHNVFDGASGFGGYRESGFGRDGGKEGLFTFVKPKSQAKHHTDLTFPTKKEDIKWPEAAADQLESVNKAIDQAHQASIQWNVTTGHARAKILYEAAEKMEAKTDLIVEKLKAKTGQSAEEAKKEVVMATERLFYYATYADKFGGDVQETQMNGLTVCLNEALGVIGIGSPDNTPLLGFVSLIAPSLARGNSVVALVNNKVIDAATELKTLLNQAKLPEGVLQVIAGDKEALTLPLVKHEHIQAVWFFGSAKICRNVEYEASQDMKRTWVNYGFDLDWSNKQEAQGVDILRKATEPKNIWMPMTPLN